MATTMQLVPPWVEPLLSARFFSPCATHGDAARGECNMFCLDCPSAAAFCFFCRSARHSDHRVVQIRRSSYHDVVRVGEVQKSLDVSGVQTYVINSARVVFLNERPQPKGNATAASSSSAAAGATKSAPHVCVICGRTLLDPFRFCSLGCKLEGIKRNGEASFVLEEEEEEEEGEDDDEDGGVVAVMKRRADRTRSGVARASERVPALSTTVRRRSGEGEEGEHGQVGLRGGVGHDMCPPPPTPPNNLRRRKGVPHRSPF